MGGDNRHLVTAQDVREPYKRSTGEKKLMTDRAFYEEIMIKMEVLVEVQKQMGISLWEDTAKIEAAEEQGDSIKKIYPK